MKCRKCGAENIASMENCGNCGTSLTLSELDSRRDDAAFPSSSHVANEGANRVGARRSQAGVTQHPSKTMRGMLLVPAIISLALGLMDLLVSYASGEGTPIMAIFMIASGLGLVFVVFFGGKRASKMANYMWQSGDRLAPIAVSRGVNMSGLYFVPLIIVIPVLLGPLIFNDVPQLVFIAPGLLVSTALLVGLLRSKVMIQNNSILVGVPSAPMMLRLPFDKTRSIRLRGRVLRVVLTEKMSPVSPTTFRYVILGDPKPIAAAIQAIGPIHEMVTTIENVELDPELLKAYIKAIPNKDEGMLDGQGRYVIDEKLLTPERSSYPEIVSGLLFFAGISAIGSAFVLVFLSGAVSDTIGRPLAILECCALLEFLFGVLIIAGAVMARKRKRYKLVRTSAILATINIGGLISVVLGIVSLILLTKSADEFED